MTWLESLTRARRYTGPKLWHRSRLHLSDSSERARDESSMAYLIESARWQDSRVQHALGYLKSLETDPDADDFAIVWARHELQRCIHAATDDILRDDS